MAAQDHREACGPARHHGDVEPHKQVGPSPLVASRRPRGAERNGLAWKPVGRNEPEEAGTRGAKGLWGYSCGSCLSASVRCGLCKPAEAARSVETAVKRPTALCAVPGAANAVALRR